MYARKNPQAPIKIRMTENSQKKGLHIEETSRTFKKIARSQKNSHEWGFAKRFAHWRNKSHIKKIAQWKKNPHNLVRVLMCQPNVNVEWRHPLVWFLTARSSTVHEVVWTLVFCSVKVCLQDPERKQISSTLKRNETNASIIRKFRYWREANQFSIKCISSRVPTYCRMYPQKRIKECTRSRVVEYRKMYLL